MQPQRKIMMVETTRTFVNSTKSKLRCQPEAQNVTLKMLCVHHIIQHQYTHASGGFYSWLFVPDHGGNRNTEL